jgi:hypothetical protein
LPESGNVGVGALRRGGDDDTLFIPQDHPDDTVKDRALEKSYFLAVPYRGAGQEIIYALEYANGYQVEAEGWAGAVAPGDCAQFTIKVRFPAGNVPDLSSFKALRGDPSRADGMSPQPEEVVLEQDQPIARVSLQSVQAGDACALVWDW